MKVIKNNCYLLRYVLASEPLYLFAMLASSVLRALVVVGEVFINKVVVNFLAGGNSSFIRISLWYVGYLICDYFCEQIIIALDNCFKSVKGIKVSKSMREGLFKKVREFDLSCYEDSGFYDAYGRVDREMDTRALQVVDTFSGFVYYVLVLLLVLVVTFDPVFLMVTVFVVLKHVVYLGKLNKLNYTVDVETNPWVRRMGYIKGLFQNISFIREIKAGRQEDFFLKWNLNAAKQEYRISERYYKKAAFQSAFSIVLGEAANFVIGVYLCFRMLKGFYTLGDFVYLFNVFVTFSSHMASLFQLFPELSAHSRYAEEIRNIMDYQSVIPEDKPIDKKSPSERSAQGNRNLPIVEFQAVNFRYLSGEDDVLKQVSFQVGRGQKIAIVGENGSGKSTLLKLLLYFYKGQGGEILYGGHPYSFWCAEQLRKRFGVVFQDYSIYAFTIAENVLMREERAESETMRVEEALKFAGLWEQVSALKYGTHTAVTKEFDGEGVFFSGGEYQKIAIARAYARDGEVLVFDEPSASLDPNSEKEIFQKILALGEDKAVVYVTHCLSMAAKADCIYYMEKGEIKEQGSHHELMGLKGGYYKMFLAQQREAE